MDSARDLQSSIALRPEWPHHRRSRPRGPGAGCPWAPRARLPLPGLRRWCPRRRAGEHRGPRSAT